MLAGLLLSASGKQEVIGISSMKGNLSLKNNIVNLIADQKPAANFKIIHDYHFGGYGKRPPALINFERCL